MCGIAGFWQFGGAGDDALQARARAMASSLRHRGPDDEGVWTDPSAGVAVGFRRLAVIDLTAAGAQPMVSASGRYVIVFNGEVYNFERLRADLRSEGVHPSYRGHSDTEVLLAAIEAWGLERAVSSFVGMFAFALWDRELRTLSLVRDRFGVKPLYYAADARGIAFASELKALERRAVDRGALALYLRYGYVPSPWSIFEGILKLEPATICTFDADGGRRVVAYWDPAERAEAAASRRFEGSEEEAMNRLEELLADAVRLRMIADVPLGVFLSGGVDSPLVTALMRRESSDVATFTLAFEGDRSGEAVAAAEIARRLGTRHTEAVVTGADALEAVPRMASIYDEPHGDSSCIPTWLVSRMARQHVTVALSGDGGDELFGGYHRHFLGQKLARRVAGVPRPLRGPVGTVLKAAAQAPVSQNARDRLRGLGSALALDDQMAVFERQVSSESIAVRDAPARGILLTERARWPRLDDATELTMYLDSRTYMIDGVLAKVDRASMAVSLEVRQPLLDHRVAELAWALPSAMKVRDGRGKWILRRLLERHLPPEIVNREKHGFGLPIDSWLRGPLRDWAASLLDASRIAREGWIEPRTVRRVWMAGPVAGEEQALWRLLMFQQWLDASK